MGTDIEGWVEVRTHEWEGIMNLHPLTDRTYSAFASLFGVKNWYGFRPLAADRGLPADASAEVRASITETALPIARDIPMPEVEQALALHGYHNATWIAWSELAAMDMTEQAPHFDDPSINVYQRDSEGRWIPTESIFWSEEFGAVSGISRAEAEAGYLTSTDARSWLDGNTLYLLERMTRRQALKGIWTMLLKMLAELAPLYRNNGPLYRDNGLRIVVWFSS